MPSLTTVTAPFRAALGFATLHRKAIYITLGVGAVATTAVVGVKKGVLDPSVATKTFAAMRSKVRSIV